MNAAIIPKSDQINADDFLSEPRSYVIEGVTITPGTEQPVSITLRGEKRVWRPCKSMSRVLVAAWGADAKVYAGRSVTLYRDPSVKWGGLEVGGIRISHLSHIERDILLQLTATKGKRSPHIVRPMREPEPAPTAEPGEYERISETQAVELMTMATVAGLCVTDPETGEDSWPRICNAMGVGHLADLPAGSYERCKNRLQATIDRNAAGAKS